MFSRCTNKCKNQKNKECTYEGLAGMEGTQGAATPKISPILYIYSLYTKLEAQFFFRLLVILKLSSNFKTGMRARCHPLFGF